MNRKHSSFNNGGEWKEMRRAEGGIRVIHSKGTLGGGGNTSIYQEQIRQKSSNKKRGWQQNGWRRRGEGEAKLKIANIK
jgi:hypothetical protein